MLSIFVKSLADYFCLDPDKKVVITAAILAGAIATGIAL